MLGSNKEKEIGTLLYCYYATYTQVQHNRRCPGELVGRYTRSWLAQVRMHRVDYYRASAVGSSVV